MLLLSPVSGGADGSQMIFASFGLTPSHSKPSGSQNHPISISSAPEHIGGYPLPSGYLSRYA